MAEYNVKWVKINNIKPYARNAKKHDDKQIANVAESIKQFGWQQPIVCDADGVIIIGHCRLLAAKKLKLDKVPVKYATERTCYMAELSPEYVDVIIARYGKLTGNKAVLLT